MQRRKTYLLKNFLKLWCFAASISAFAGSRLVQTVPITSTSSVPRVKVKEWGPAFEGVKQIYGQATADRSNLAHLREKHIAKFEQEERKDSPDFLSLTPEITSDMIDYINIMVAQTIAKIGPPPTPFSLFTMGSMARDESGFFTDLEVGILVDKKTEQVKKYFEAFAQLLSDRLYLLGEHPLVQGKGLRIDEADNAPLHRKWFARYASPTQIQTLFDIGTSLGKKDLKPNEGSRIFLATPEEFASYLDPEIENLLKTQQDSFLTSMRSRQREAWDKELQKPEKQRRSREEVINEIREAYGSFLKPLHGYEIKVLKSLLGLTRNLRHLYGNRAIFDRFVAESKKILDGPASVDHPNYKTRREEIVIDEWTGDINKFIGDPDAPVHGKIDDDLDIKRRLYRWPEQVLTNLSYWYDLGMQNGEQIIRELTARGLLDPQLGLKIRDLLNYATGLRLKEQAVLKKQGKTVPLTIEEWTKGKEKLKEELAFQKNYEAFALKMQAPLKTITTDDNGNIINIKAENASEILAERDLIHDKVLELQVELASFDKLKPLASDSIIQAKDVEKLNSIYLPILSELFLRSQEFVKGDKTAFILSTQEFTEKYPIAAANTGLNTLIPMLKRSSVSPAVLLRRAAIAAQMKLANTNLARSPLNQTAAPAQISNFKALMQKAAEAREKSALAPANPAVTSPAASTSISNFKALMQKAAEAREKSALAPANPAVTSPAASTSISNFKALMQKAAEAREKTALAPANPTVNSPSTPAPINLKAPRERTTRLRQNSAPARTDQTVNSPSAPAPINLKAPRERTTRLRQNSTPTRTNQTVNSLSTPARRNLNNASVKNAAVRR